MMGTTTVGELMVGDIFMLLDAVAVVTSTSPFSDVTYDVIIKFVTLDEDGTRRMGELAVNRNVVVKYRPFYAEDPA